VDTQGLLLGVAVTEANTQDRLGGVAVLLEEACESERLQLLWVDQGYTGEKFAFASASICGAQVEVVKRTEGTKIQKEVYYTLREQFNLPS
jgi:transposase